ncbi:TetR/AcrR family transcriptional regulator [Phenylobacterium sp.]|uniref:TetR/AcrR family transcriptional regulator n=1 Tax=Phenylobacterium sp. TaxID=1871053 RepID=UPI0025DC552D|nr:helix-turn-helix domain-containing protein [Phenylobacterium sp.]MBX3485974.1 helix-turn-helix transcriptional regulator [Phenylobacterium sp.]MCW5758524.1 helix-turn-helix transcriptional regulator [Phenylobacterium sp.]
MSRTSTKAAPPKAAAAPKAAERILATASELFYREGARAVGVDEIVVRAGTTKPSLYRAFESKDHLIAAYLEGRSADAWSWFEKAAAAHPGDPRAQVLDYIDALSGRALKGGYRGCGLSNAAIEYPEAGHPGRKVSVKHKEKLRERLRDLTRAMGARKPRKLADSLLLIIEGVHVTSQLFGAEGPAAAARGAAETLIDAHMRGHV